MPDVSTAERLLSLLTTRDRAAAIVGDLLEHDAPSSSAAFGIDVIRIWFALWRGSIVNTPMRIVRLAGTALLLMTGPMFAGVAAMALFPAEVEVGLSAFVLLVIWSAGAVWTGTLLTRLAPDRGVVASLAVAIISGAIFTALVVNSPAQRLPLIPKTFVFVAVASVPLLLIVGSSVARDRSMTQSIPTG